MLHFTSFTIIYCRFLKLIKHYEINPLELIVLDQKNVPFIKKHLAFMQIHALSGHLP